MTTARRHGVTTPWGGAEIVEEVRLPQRAGAKRFGSILQLLETPKGDALIRLAYTTGGGTRRGPVTLRMQDVHTLRAALERTPRLREALQEALL
jgi:hypothetical protein